MYNGLFCSSSAVFAFTFVLCKWRSRCVSGGVGGACWEEPSQVWEEKWLWVMTVCFLVIGKTLFFLLPSWLSKIYGICSSFSEPFRCALWSVYCVLFFYSVQFLMWRTLDLCCGCLCVCFLNCWHSAVESMRLRIVWGRRFCIGNLFFFFFAICV